HVSKWWREANMKVIFFFQAEDGIRDASVTGVQTCALPISHTQHTHTHTHSVPLWSLLVVMLGWQDAGCQVRGPVLLDDGFIMIREHAHTHTHTLAHTHPHTFTHARTHTPIGAHTHTHASTLTHTHTHTHTHYTHTHTQTHI